MCCEELPVGLSTSRRQVTPEYDPVFLSLSLKVHSERYTPSHLQVSLRSSKTGSVPNLVSLKRTLTGKTRCSLG
jgi:hypothetical protein